MKRTGSKFALGGFVWLVLCVLLAACCLPVTMIGGSISSTLGGNFVARTLTPIICPEGSTGEIVTFDTTTTDENGNPTPSTGYEMQCVDGSGNITREPSADYAFTWMLILSAAGLLLAALVALLLVAPASVLVNRLFGGSKKSEAITS